jgi:hypothetical protein
VRRGSTVGGDQCEHLLEVEQRGVRRREITGDENEGVARVGDAGCVETPQVREHALCDVIEIRCALAEVAADRLQRGAESGEGVVHSPFGGAAVVDAGIDLVLKSRVLGDHGLRLEHFLGGATCGVGTLLQLGGDRRDGFPGTGALCVGADRARRVLGGRQRLRHSDDGALGDAAADAHAAQLGHPAAS